MIRSHTSLHGLAVVFYSAIAICTSTCLSIRSPLAIAAEPAPPPGIVFSFGGNFDGRGGLGTQTSFTLVPTRIATSTLGGRRISQIATGNAHSLLIAEDGTAFTFGWNDFGQLGTGDRNNRYIATPVTTTNFSGQSVKLMAAGATHSFLVSENGTAYAMGENRNGQTGIGTTSGNALIPTPINVSNLGGKQIVQMDGAEYFSLFLTEDGVVYSFGDNTSGRTGRGTNVGQTLAPSQIDMTNLNGESVIQISAGGNIPEGYGLLLTDAGTVYAFGSNANGKTGLGTTSGNTLVATPIDTTNIGNRRIVQAMAGVDHSLLLADDGTVFAFGSNEQGRTGLNSASGNTLIATPIDMSNLAGKEITQIAAALYNSYLLADDGSIFAFGHNPYNGIGTISGNTLVASPINMSNLDGLRVIDIAAGSGHVLLLAVPEPAGMTLMVLAVALAIGGRPRRS